MCKGQLHSAMMQNCFKKSKKLLNIWKHPLEKDLLCFFSDKKNFCQNQTHNSQNNSWLAVCPKDVPRVMQTKFTATVMVSGVACSEDQVMPPVLLSAGALGKHLRVH